MSRVLLGMHDVQAQAEHTRLLQLGSTITRLCDVIRRVLSSVDATYSLPPATATATATSASSSSYAFADGEGLEGLPPTPGSSKAAPASPRILEDLVDVLAAELSRRCR